jgi:hypothetical protein
MKVLYAGLPMRLCESTTCNCCFGGLSWIMEYVPFNGVFIRYDSYWKGLWKFLTDPVEDDQ